MTRKDFVLIAGALAQANKHVAAHPEYAEGWHAALTSAAVHLADRLAGTNPNFDRARFLKACTGVQS